MNIKELFEKAENGMLTYEQFQAAATAAGAKFTDLSEGQYVSKHKHESEVESLQGQISQLNETIGTRDNDLAELQKKLEEAGTDAEKLNTLSGDFATLQSKYDADIKSYKDQLKNQAYEFAVKDFVSTQKFTSNAAKKEFTRAMIEKGLKMDKDKILGAEDFLSSYKAENEDSFLKDENPSDPAPSAPLPQFAGPTPGGSAPVDQTGGFASAFHFTGVRPIPTDHN